MLCVSIAVALMYADIAKAQSSEYRLGPGDRIQVEVFGRSDLSGMFTIRESGFVSLPIAGEIDASSLSLKQLEMEIEKKYTEIMKSESGPDQAINANIEIVEHRPFYVIGDVNRPGSYEYRPGLTVLRAIAIAGGYVSAGPATENASRSDSAEDRQSAGVRITRETDRGRLSFGAADNTVVLPGDIIAVPRREIRAFPLLPDREQQTRLLEAVPAKEGGAGETVTGAESASKAIPTTEDPVKEDRTRETGMEAVTDSEAKPVTESPVSDHAYTVYLFSTTSATVADQVNQEFRRAGHESTVMLATGSDVTRYRVGVTGFESHQAAQQYAESISATLGITDAWVGRGRPAMVFPDN